MDKQEIQEAVAEAHEAIRVFGDSSAIEALREAANDFDLEYEVGAALAKLTDLVNKVAEEAAAPAFNTPANVPTVLDWEELDVINDFPAEEEGTILAQILVTDCAAGGLWNIFITPDNTVVLDVDNYFGGFDTNLQGFANVDNAKAAAQSAIEAVAKVLTLNDGDEFVCEEFRQALSDALHAQGVAA